jgi:hypothetical protein
VLRRTRYFVESIYPAVLDYLLSIDSIAAARIDHLSPESRDAALAPKASALAPKATALAPKATALAPKATALAPKAVATDDSSEKKKRPVLTFNERVNSTRLHGEEAKDVRDEKSGYLVRSSKLDGLDVKSVVSHTTIVLASDERKIQKSGAPERSLSIDNASILSENASVLPLVLSFEINPAQVEEVRKRCLDSDVNYPMLEEYDFRRDNTSADLPIGLRPSTQIRPYQEKSLSKMFSNGRARSGIIVLPCGAGKTLVGITACSTIRKSTLIYCTTGVAVDQWKKQVLLWTGLPERYVCQFTASHKECPSTEACVVITTYNMVAYQGSRAKDTEKMMKMITTHEWGLVILDEVHVAPASQFKKVYSHQTFVHANIEEEMFRLYLDVHNKKKRERERERDVG